MLTQSYIRSRQTIRDVFSSHRLPMILLGWGVWEMPFCWYSVILLMVSKISKVFSVLVLRGSTIWEVEYFLRFNFTLDNWEKSLLEVANCNSIMNQRVRHHHAANAFECTICLIICNGWMQSCLRICPVVSLCRILYNKSIILTEITKHNDVAFFQLFF